VQSYDDRLLALLGRIHSAEEAQAAVRDARAAGFENLNLDLMMGLPQQRLGDWQKTVQRALDLAPQHLSLYALTLEEDTPLAAQIDRGALPAPDDDLAAEMYEWAREALAQAGYDHYEISNWAQTGYACQHNLIYWRNEPYLGLGAGAHSWFGGQRQANLREPQAYIRALRDQSMPETQRLHTRHRNTATTVSPGSPSCRRGSVVDPAAVRFPVAEVERIDRALEMSETMMMGLRLLDEGVSYARFERRFGLPLEEAYGPQIAAAVEEGLLERASERGSERTADRVRLTRRGALLGNRVFVRFVGEGY
jgi:oxygen-independent coproporphyrinogen-3 oxidase